MAINSEEMRIRMALDATSLKAGSDAVLQDQKKKAMEYTSFWKRALDDREAMETRSAVEQAARNNKAAALWRQRERDRVEATKQAEAEITAAQQKSAYQNNPQRLQQQAANQSTINAQIASGSGGWGWRKDAAAKGQGGAAGMIIAGGVTSGIATAASGGSAGNVIGSVGTGIGYGAAFAKIEKWINGIINEGSFTHGLKGVGGAFKKLGVLIAEHGAMLAKGTGVIAAVIGSAEIAWHAIKMGEAAAVEGKSISDLHGLSVSLKDRLLKELEMKHSLGQIGNDEYNGLSYKLNSGVNQSDIKKIQNRFLELNDTYDAGENAQKIQDAAGKRKGEADKELNKMIHGKRDEAQIQSDLNSGKNIQSKLESEIALLKSKQTLTADENIRLVEREAELSEQKLENAKDAEALKEKELESQKEALRVTEELGKASQEVSDLENQKSHRNDRYSSIEELAGRNFVAGLNRRYGKGGQLDLGTGGGAGGAASRNFMESEKRQLYDRQFARDHYENQYGQEVSSTALGGRLVTRDSIINADRSRMDAARDALTSSGVIQADPQLESINNKLTELYGVMDKLQTAATGDGITTKIKAD